MGQKRLIEYQNSVSKIRQEKRRKTEKTKRKNRKRLLENLKRKRKLLTFNLSQNDGEDVIKKRERERLLEENLQRKRELEEELTNRQKQIQLAVEDIFELIKIVDHKNSDIEIHKKIEEINEKFDVDVDAILACLDTTFI